MKSTRTLMMAFSIAAVIALVFLGAQLQVPTALALPILHFSKVHAVPGDTQFNPVPLGSNTCLGSGCHVSTGSSGTATITGLPASYTGGSTTPIPLTVTISDTGGPRIGYELTARLASNTANAAGTLMPGTNSKSGTNVVPVVQGLVSAPTNTFSLTWTPPAKGSGSVNFYLTGWSGSFPSGHPYTAMYTLTEAASTPPPPSSTLSASPSTLTFNYTQGSAAPGSQQIMVTGSPVGLAYTAVASGATWLSVSSSSASGAVPGTVNVVATPGTLPPGTYNGGIVTITAAGATGSPQVVGVTLVITAAPTTSSLTASPTSLHFSYTPGGAAPAPQNLAIGATGSTALNFSASYSGGTWVTLNPTSGTTPRTISVSAAPGTMTAGTYNGTIKISAPGVTSLSVPVTLTIGGSSGGGTSGSMYAQPYVYYPYTASSSGGLSAQWVSRLGDTTQYNNQALVLSVSASAPAGSWAGAHILNYSGLSLTEVGFDYLDGSECTATSPRIVVSDGTTNYVVAGCSAGAIQTDVPVKGWRRVRFDLQTHPELATPQITPGVTVKSITLVMDQLPESVPGALGGFAVIDNIDVNGTLITSGASYSHDD